jgi:hypothetical protein
LFSNAAVRDAEKRRVSTAFRPDASAGQSKLRDADIGQRF